MDETAADRKLWEEGLILRRIFPDEIWMLIADQLSDDDLERMSNASPFFRELLLSKRIFFLFPKVLDPLTVCLQNCLDDDPKEMEGSAILSFRKVCKPWMQSVDSCIQDVTNLKMARDHDNNEFQLDCLERATTQTFVGLEDLNAFLEHFKDTHQPDKLHSGDMVPSPFLGRQVSIVCEYNGPGDKLLIRGISTLLRNYGVHIWDLDLILKMKFSRHSIINRIVMLQNWLQNVPNLKVLKIGSYPEDDQNYDDEDSDFEEELEPEDEEIELPKLHNLESMVTHNLPTAIFNRLFRSNNHISRLNVRRKHDDYDIYSVPLPNLTQLAMQFWSPSTVLTLDTLDGNWPLLRSFCFRYYQSEHRVITYFMQWSNMFRVLENQFGAALTSLVIDFPEAIYQEDKMSIFDDSLMCKMHLPHIQHLHLVMRNPAHLDFLLPMKDSLKKLEINKKYYYEAHSPCKLPLSFVKVPTPEIKFLGYEKNMLESNIWSIFKNLEQVSVINEYSVKHVYKIQEWHKFMECKKVNVWTQNGIEIDM